MSRLKLVRDIIGIDTQLRGQCILNHVTLEDVMKHRPQLYRITLYRLVY